MLAAFSEEKSQQTCRSTPRVDLNVAPFRPSQLLQALAECRQVIMKFRVVLGMRHQHADPPFPFALLRPCRERPCCRRATDKAMNFRRLMVPSNRGLNPITLLNEKIVHHSRMSWPHFRFGSNSAVSGFLRHGCFTLKTGHWLARLARPKKCQSRPDALQQQR
jgi:hypothetical protein